MVKFFRDNESRKTHATMTKYIKVIQHMMWFIDSWANYDSTRQWPSRGWKENIISMDITSPLEQRDKERYSYYPS